MNKFILLMMTLSFLLVGFYEIYNRKSNKILDFIIIVFALFFITYRGLYYPDTTGYAKFYNFVETNKLYLSPSDLPGTFTFDLGYSIFNQLIKYFFGPNFRILFLSITLINFSLVYLVFKKLYNYFFNRNSNAFLLGVFFSIYVSYYGLLYNAAVLRAGLSMSILLVAYLCALKKKWVLYVLSIILAVLFHSSAIIGIIITILLITNFALSKKQYTVLWIIMGILYLFRLGENIVSAFPRLFGFLSQYDSLYVFSKYNERIPEMNSMLSPKILYFFLFGGLFLTKQLDRSFSRFLNIYYVGLFILLLLPISYMSRVADFFMFNIFILQYLFLEKITKRELKITYFLITVICNIILVSRILYQGIN